MIRHRFWPSAWAFWAICMGLSARASESPATGLPAATHTATAQHIGLPLVLQSAARNLGVQLAQRNLEAYRADVLTANRAPLPNLTLRTASIDLQNGVGHTSGSGIQDWRVDKSVGIDVVWERGNKRSLRTQASEQLVGAAQADLQETQTQQQLLATVVFFDWAGAHQREALMHAMAQSAHQLHQATQVRLRAGDVSEQDADRIAMEWSRAQGDVAQARSEHQRLALVLQQLTALPGPTQHWKAQINWPDAAHIHPIEWGDAQTQSWVQSRSDVKAAEQRLLAARSALELAQSLKKKDITWGGAYDHYPPNSNSLLELRVQIPLHWGYGFEGEIGRATAQLQQAEVALERARVLAQSDIHDAIQALRSSQERLQLYETSILPRAQKIAAQADYAYQKGGLSLTDLMDARRNLRITHIDALSVRTEHAKALTQWDIRTRAVTPLRQPTDTRTP